MNNKSLKHKLDQLPNDFDREALWRRINLPQKKSRRKIKFLWFGASLLLILLINSALYLTKEKSLFIEGSYKELHQKQSIMQPEIATVHISPIKTVTDLESPNLSNKSKVNILKSDLENQIKTLNSTLNHQNNNTKKCPSIADQSIKQIPLLSGKESQDFEIINDQLKKRLIENRKIVSPEPLNGEINMGAQKSQIIERYYPIIKPFKSTSIWRGDCVHLGIGLSNDRHNFSNIEQAADRELIERNLESYSFVLGISKPIYGRWSLSLNLSHHISYTYLEKQIRSESQSVSLPNIIIMSVATDYKLYNNYRRTDLDFMLGHIITAGLWKFTTSAGIGYGANHSQSGHLYDNEFGLIPIDRDQNYKTSSGIYYQGKFSAQKRFNSHLGFGIDIWYQSERNLMEPNFQIHTIKPMGMNLSASYYLN